MEQQSSSSQTAHTPQIRSRITVVCAECKRLKLKCDRRSPCSSCTKRDTIARCIYSPAAAEKVDLHSLNNRLMQVEATLAQLTAGSFQSAYPPAQPHNVTSGNFLPSSFGPPAVNPPPARTVPFPQENHQHQHRHHPAAVITHVHDVPYPLALSLDELHFAWLDSVESGRSGRSTLGCRSSKKVELSPAETERRTRFRARLGIALYPHSRHPNPQPLLPRVSEYYSENKSYGSPYTSRVPSITSTVLGLLPSSSICLRILARARPVLAQRPVPLPGGWNEFEERAINLIHGRSNNLSAVELESGQSVLKPIFTSESEPVPSKEKRKAEEDLIFFSITTAILAIGAAVSPPEEFDSENVNAGVLYALSQQALSVWEESSSKKSEKDYVLFLVACLAGINYLLLVTQDNANDSRERKEEIGAKPRAIFAMVGKIVNIAREIGLGKEKAAWQELDDRPSSRADSHHHWEDFCCVVWWDVMFYDLFTSDALGHPSLIPPVSCPARLPEFNSSLYDSATRKYVIARCRLVQLAQHVKHRLSHPECCCGYTFDQATRSEDEIRRWSRDYISQDEDEKADELGHNWELSLVAQVLIIRVYVPFLISANSAVVAKKADGALDLTKLPGKPGSGEKLQIQGNAMAMATQSCLDAAQAILRLGNKLNGLLCREPGKSFIVQPLLMDLYPLERLVLDAVVIIQSSAAVSIISEVEVKRGMEIMMDREFNLGRKRREVWEMIKQRVAPSKLQISTQVPQQPVKRKFDQFSPVAANSDGVTLKKECISTKHTKTGPPPVLGVRYRQGRMGPAGPAHQHVPRPESYTLSDAQLDVIPHEQMAELQHPIPHSVSRPSLMSYDDSLPVAFPSESSLQVEPAYPTPSEHLMTGHHSSFEQTKPIYNSVEEGPIPPSYGASDPNSASSSPYQCTARSDDASRRTPMSQLNMDSPAGSYGSTDGQTAGNSSRRSSKFSPDARPFENSRLNFTMENPQPQTFDKMQLAPSAFSYSRQSPSANGASSPSDNGADPQFGIPQHETTHPSAGYFHHGSGLAPYDTNDMMTIRMDESVPGTPVYEKPHMMYDKAPQQQVLQHSGHPITVNGRTQIVNHTFVGDQAQDLAMTRGPQHLSWSSVQSPQSLVPASQPFW